MFALMCCGCRRLMGRHGKSVTGGVFDLALVAEAATPDEMNAIAEAAGWQVRDKIGPNHWCPACLVLHRLGHATWRPGGRLPSGGSVPRPGDAVSRR